MPDSNLNDRLWRFFWYFLLPAALSVALVQGLANIGVTQEAAPWQYLLAFSVNEVVVLSALEWFLGSRRPGGLRNLRTIEAEASELKYEARALLKRAKANDELRALVDEAIKKVEEALSKRNAAEAAEATRALDELLEKRLGHARKGVAREYVEAIGFAVLVALVIRAFFLEAFRIPSPSMYPTLNVGDNIFVNKFVYGPLLPYSNRRIFQGRLPERGEVVVFVYPQDPSKDFIKRVIGLPGDRIFFRADGQLEINGRLQSRCEVGVWNGDDGDGRLAGTPGEAQHLYVEWLNGRHFLTLRQRDFFDPGERRERTFGLTTPYTVPEGHIFVAGDNRDNSYDSRFWGPVPIANIKGKALWIWWSNLPGAGCGMRWHRFGHNILGDPFVPSDMQAGYDACMRRGPN